MEEHEKLIQYKERRNNYYIGVFFLIAGAFSLAFLTLGIYLSIFFKDAKHLLLLLAPLGILLIYTVCTNVLGLLEKRSSNDQKGGPLYKSFSEFVKNKKSLKTILTNTVLAIVVILSLVGTVKSICSEERAIYYVQKYGQQTTKLKSYTKQNVISYCEYTLYEHKNYVHTEGSQDVEHIFAQDWADKINKTQISNDYFNLRWSVRAVNNLRSNYGFGTLEKSSNQTQEVKDQQGNLCGWRDNYKKIFEPVDEYKGDIARTLLYVYYRYDLSSAEIDPYFSLKKMIKWAKKDKLSKEERNTRRNIYKNEDYDNFFLTRQNLVNYFN